MGVITVAVVNWGNYLSRGEEYVRVLKAMVARNLSQPFELHCITEHGDLFGWWVKIALFEPGRFKGRVLYLDLDSVVVGNLDELVESKGIIDMRDWGWGVKTYNSSVMVWDAGEHEDVYTKFTKPVTRLLDKGGDQEWITKIGGWESLPPYLVKSYRYHSVKAPPTGCSVCTFHGNPKPHDVVDGWVPKFWRP